MYLVECCNHRQKAKDYNINGLSGLFFVYNPNAENERLLHLDKCAYCGNTVFRVIFEDSKGNEIERKGLGNKTLQPGITREHYLKRYLKSSKKVYRGLLKKGYYWYTDSGKLKQSNQLVSNLRIVPAGLDIQKKRCA